MLAGEGFIGGEHSDEEINDEDESALQSKSLIANGATPEEIDERKELKREEKLYNKIYARFRVLLPHEVDAMLDQGPKAGILTSAIHADEETPNARSPKSKDEPGSAAQAKINKKRKPNEVLSMRPAASAGNNSLDG